MKKIISLIFVLLLTIPSWGIIAELDSETWPNLDISSIQTILTDTPDGSSDMLCQAYITLGSAGEPLEGSGGAFEFTMTIGGQTVQPSPQIAIFGTEARVSIWTSQFLVPAGESVVITVESPNADTADVKAYLYDVFPVITASGIVSADLADNVTHGGPDAVLNLKSMTVSNPDGDGVTFESTFNGDASGFVATGADFGAGILATGGADEGPGIKAVGGAPNGHGFETIGDGTGAGIYVQGGDNNGTGMVVRGGSTDGSGMIITGINEGDGLFVTTGNGSGLKVRGSTGIDADEIDSLLSRTALILLDGDNIIDKISAMMSKAYTLLTAVGTYDPATDALEAQQENPQAPPIID